MSGPGQCGLRRCPSLCHGRKQIDVAIKVLGVTRVPNWDQGSEASRGTEVFIQTQGGLGEALER